jgi:uncharacterized membrane protein
MNDAPNLGRYVGIFVVAQLAVMVILVILAFAFGLQPGSSTNLVGTAVAAMATAHFFVRTHGRAPTAEERKKLAWLSLAAVWGVALGMLGLLAVAAGRAAFEPFLAVVRGLPVSGWVLITLFVSALYLGIFYINYGWFAGLLARSIKPGKR